MGISFLLLYFIILFYDLKIKKSKFPKVLCITWNVHTSLGMSKINKRKIIIDVFKLLEKIEILNSTIFLVLVLKNFKFSI